MRHHTTDGVNLGTFHRKGCICTGEWPKLSRPIEEPPRNRAERRDKTRPRMFWHTHYHSPECNAKWAEIKQEHAS